MKTLLYTVSNFNSKSKECIELMLSNIDNKNNFDFVVISNNLNHPKNFSVIIDDSKINYIGDLKYSQKIPHGYDRYVYLDSDILFYGDLNILFDDSKDFSVVFEEGKPMSLEYFSYPLQDETHRNVEKSLTGLNAGTFSFRDIKFLDKVRYNLNAVKNANPYTLEQSSFNYTLSKEINYDFSKVHDLTKITKLFAQNTNFQNDKLLYHFCGYTGSMDHKFESMTNFNNAVLRNKG